jgi:predicted lipoprotein
MLGRRRWIIGATFAAGSGVLLYFIPLFHVVPITLAGKRADGAPFDPVAFVDRFWADRLIPGAAGAVDAVELVTALQNDRQAARRTHGRSVGLGGASFFFLAGTGRVISVEKNSVGLSLRYGQPQVQVVLETGNIFGNTVRDGTGLLTVNDFPNSQDFNTVSSEINRHIEQQVLPALRNRAAVGATVRFVGCAEVVDEDAVLLPLRVVPFVAEFP